MQSLLGEGRAALVLQHFQQSDAMALEAAYHAKMALQLMHEGVEAETVKMLKPVVKRSRDYFSWRLAGLKLGFGTQKARKTFYHKIYSDSANDYDECQGLMMSSQKILQGLVSEDSNAGRGNDDNGRADHSADRGAGGSRPQQNTSSENTTHGLAVEVAASPAEEVCEDRREDAPWRRSAPSEGGKTREHWPELEDIQSQQFRYSYVNASQNNQSYQDFCGQQYANQSSQFQYPYYTGGQQQQSSQWQAYPKECQHWQQPYEPAQCYFPGSPSAPNYAGARFAPEQRWIEVEARPSCQTQRSMNPLVEPLVGSAMVPAFVRSLMINSLQETLETRPGSLGSTEETLSYLCAQQLVEEEKQTCVDILTKAVWVHGNQEDFLANAVKALCHLVGAGCLRIFMQGFGMGTWRLQPEAQALQQHLLVPTLASALAHGLKEGSLPKIRCTAEAICSILKLLQQLPESAMTRAASDCFEALLAFKDAGALEEQVREWLCEQKLPNKLQGEVWKLLAATCQQRGLIFGESIGIEDGATKPYLQVQSEPNKKLKIQAQKIVKICGDDSSWSQEQFCQLLKLLVHLEPFKDVLHRVWRWRHQDATAMVALTRHVIEEIGSTNVMETVVRNWVLSVWSESPHPDGQNEADHHQAWAQVMHNLQRRGSLGAHLADAWAGGMNVRQYLLEELTEKWRSSKVIGCLERVGLFFGINDDASWLKVEKASGDHDKVYFHRSLVLLHDLKAFADPIVYKIWKLLLDAKPFSFASGKELRAQVEAMGKFADVLPAAVANDAANLVMKLFTEVPVEVFQTKREFKAFQLEALGSLKSIIASRRIQPSEKCREKCRELSNEYHLEAGIHQLAQDIIN